MKSSKRFMFTVVAVAITLLTSCKKENMKEQIIGRWERFACDSKKVESMPTNSKDIDWEWIYNLPPYQNNRYLIFTEKTLETGDVNPYKTCPYSMDDDGKITIDCDWDNDGMIYYAKIKDEYLLWVELDSNEFEGGHYFFGEKLKRVSE